MTIPQTPLLTITRLVVLLAMFLIFGGAILCLLIATGSYFAWPDLAAEILKESPGIAPESIRLLLPAMLVAASALLTVVGWGLAKLLALVNSVKQGNPFTRENVARLRTMGWIMVAVELLGLPLHALAQRIGEHVKDFELDAGISLNGILAILLVFVLARVFEYGVALRDDLEGTV